MASSVHEEVYYSGFECRPYIDKSISGRNLADVLMVKLWMMFLTLPPDP